MHLAACRESLLALGDATDCPNGSWSLRAQPCRPLLHAQCHEVFCRTSTERQCSSAPARDRVADHGHKGQNQCSQLHAERARRPCDVMDRLNGSWPLAAPPRRPLLHAQRPEVSSLLKIILFPVQSSCWSFRCPEDPTLCLKCSSEGSLKAKE